MTPWRHFPYARVHAQHDGDTLEVEIDAGFGAFHRVAIRLFGISAPEVKGQEKEMGLEALREARELAWSPEHINGIPCELWTWKRSFDRYVGRVMIQGRLDLARALIGRGYGHAWDGKTPRRPFARTYYPIKHASLDEVEAYDRLLEKEMR